MELLYRSTRGDEQRTTASQAILQGLALDGGLYIPESIPKLNIALEDLAKMNYQEIAYIVMKEFFTDFTEKELKDCIAAAYDEKFDTPEITTVKKVGLLHYLELFHGETIAFKDMALSILPHLMTTSAKKNKLTDEIVILTATSGDTGKAAMAGFADVPGTKIIVFYPKTGVSEIQKKQMITQKGENTYVVAIEGNFDHAQTNVKAMFNNIDLRQKMKQNGYQFSSANSMNIGRLIPQIAYYVYAYAQLLKNNTIKVGAEINFSVPTGNFGNILSAYYAKEMGLPIHKLICASNPNKVLTDFFTSGTYDRNRPFFVTTSPSMDILVSSNLERLVYHATGNNTGETNKLMEKLANEGHYSITKAMQQLLCSFYSNFATEEETKQTITDEFTQHNYVIDPHTAVATKVLNDYQKESADLRPAVVVSTASPYKFPRVVVEALSQRETTQDDFELVEELHKLSQVSVPKAVIELSEASVRHACSVPENQMQHIVEEILALN